MAQGCPGTPLNKIREEVAISPTATWDVQLSRRKSRMQVINVKWAVEPGYHNPSP